MLSIKKLRFKGIGRFIDIQEISFESLGSLVQVDGKNNNTGGSSGAGKTTVFNALDFLFGLNSTSNSMLQSRLTEDSIFVEGEFDLDGQPLLISRSKKLKITLNGETTTGSSKISEEKLDQILSITRDLFRPMLHKKQGEKGFFLGFTPSEMNSFLTDCLGLGKWKSHITNLDLKLTDLSKKIGTLQQSLESNNMGLKASQDAINCLGSAPIQPLDQLDILALKDKMVSSNTALNILLDQHRKSVEDLESKRPAPIIGSFDRSRREKHESYINNIRDQINALKMKENDRCNKIKESISTIKLTKSKLEAIIAKGILFQEEAIKLALKVKKIRENQCPTCEQSWANDSAKNEELKLLENIKACKDGIDVANQAKVKLTESDEQEKALLLEFFPNGPVAGIEDLKKEEESILQIISEEKKKENEYQIHAHATNKKGQEIFTEQQNLLRDRQYIESEQLRGQALIDSKTYDSAINIFRNHHEIVTRYQKSLRTLKIQEESYIQKINEISIELKDTNTLLLSFEELKKAIKSYLSCSFDEALETISENATKMIQNIPNMATATIQLQGLKETKEGKVKEEVNSVIHMDGEENIPIKTLSGGERASVDIAIDIAVLGLIEDKTNKGIDLIILDEPFTGLDATNIEMVLEVLKNANTHKKIIVVDHNSVVKEQISDRITVVRDGLTSKVIQN